MENDEEMMENAQIFLLAVFGKNRVHGRKAWQEIQHFSSRNLCDRAMMFCRESFAYHVVCREILADIRTAHFLIFRIQVLNPNLEIIAWIQAVKWERENARQSVICPDGRPHDPLSPSKGKRESAFFRSTKNLEIFLHQTNRGKRPTKENTFRLAQPWFLFQHNERYGQILNFLDCDPWNKNIDV